MSDCNLHGQTFNQWCKAAGYTIPEMCKLTTKAYSKLRDDWRSGRVPSEASGRAAQDFIGYDVAVNPEMEQANV